MDTNEIKKFDLENCTALTFSRQTFGNRKQADKRKIETDADKNYLNLTKQLVKAPELDRINSFLNDLRSWIVNRSVPSFFKDGVYLVSNQAVKTIDDKLNNSIPMLSALVADFKNAYEYRIKEAEERLNGQFNRRDYPTTDELERMFSIKWSWITLSVPQTLPDEIYRQEMNKARQQWEEAAEQIRDALRSAFLQLVSHAREKLTPDADGKEKIFRDSTINNIKEFIETFNIRNLTDDRELEKLIAQAKEITGNYSTDAIRNVSMVREAAIEQFKAIETTLDSMVERKPTRKFSFDDEA